MFAVLLGELGAAAVNDGSPDTTLGPTGAKVILSIGEPYGLVSQGNGKFVVSGLSGPDTNYATLGRFNADGSVDPTFGSRLTPGFFKIPNTTGKHVFQLPDGRLLLTLITGQGLALARVSADGVPDAAFGAGGVVLTGFTVQYVSAALQPDGKLVLLGYSTAPGVGVTIRTPVLARYNPDGSLDGSFGTGGQVSLSRPAGVSDDPRSLALQEDGKIVVVGAENNGQSDSQSFVIRLTPTGALDTTFGNGGIATTVVTNSSSVYYCVTIQPDGKIVAGGWALVLGKNFQASLVRYNPDGSLDGTFGIGGIVLRTYGGVHDEFRTLLVQDDGKIIGAGFAAGTRVTPGLTMEFARFNPDGSTDTDFGSGGVSYSNVGQEGEVNALIQLEDGKLLAVGDSGNPTGHDKDWVAARFTGPAPTPPVARADAYAGPVDTALTVAAPGVIQNDTQSGAWTLRAMLQSGPAHGLLTLSRTGGFTYTPDAGYVGVDSFTYLASDGILQSAPVTVTLNVVGANHAPTAAGDTYALDQDTLVNIPSPGVLANDADPDGDALSASLVTGPAHGTLNLNASGAFSYIPVAGFRGTDSFTYRVSDGAASSNTATVSLSVRAVNHPPASVNDTYVAQQDTPLTVSAPGVLQNDTDPDGDALTASVVTAPAQGTVNLSSSGAFTYTPAAGYRGGDSFTYRVSDGVVFGNTATVSLSVRAVNHAPTAIADSFAVLQDVPLGIGAPGVLGNDADPDGDPLSAVLESGPAHGTLQLKPDGSLSYTPNTGYTGADSFTYHASDGTLSSSPVTVTLNVRATNRAPVAGDDTYAAVAGVDLRVPVAGILGNDSDPDGDAVTAALISTTIYGNLVLKTDGSFVYTPNLTFRGTDRFLYKATDGAGFSQVATVNLIVSAPGHAPVAAPDSYSTPQDTPLSITAPGVLQNDSDPDGDALSAVLVNGPGHGTLSLTPGGGFTYTPAAGYHGTDSFTYAAADGQSQSAPVTVTLNVSVTDQPPVAAADSYSTPQGAALTVAAPGVLGNDSDPDGDPLTAQIVTPPAHGSLSLAANGSFTYTPAAGYHGTDAFTYAAADGQLTRTAVVTLTVTPVNHAPTTADDAFTVKQGEGLTVSAASGVLHNDADLDNDPLTAQLVTDAAHGTLHLNSDGSLIYTPLATFSGTDSFTYRAGDGQAYSSPATVRITITAGVPSSTTGAKVSGSGTVGAGSTPALRFSLSASVNKKGKVSGSFKWKTGAPGAFKSSQVTAVVVTGTHARVWGKGLVGTKLTDFVVDVDDLGPASQHKDRIQVLIGASSFGPGTVQSGDIKVTSPRR